MQREIRALTGLRGVAACLVVLRHFTNADVGLPWMRRAITHGYLAVDLFFVLSGFVMAMTYGRLFQTEYTLANHLGFLGKRLGRIYPLYLGMTILMLALGAAGVRAGPVVSPAGIVANVLLVQAWAMAWSVYPPAWSISTEWAAYIAFPILAPWLLFRRQGYALLAAASALLVIGWLVLGSGGFPNPSWRQGPLDLSDPRTPWPLLRCMAGFCLGAVAWRVAGVPAMRSLLRRGWVSDGTTCLALVLLAAPRRDFVLVALFPMLVASLATAESAASAMVGGRVCHALGVVSYSIYMVHWPMRTLAGPLNAALHGAGVPHSLLCASASLFAATLPCAALTFHGIERPFRRMSRAWIGAGQAHAASASAPVAPL